MCLCRLRIPIERQLWETRAAPRPTYLWSGTCPLQLRAYTQIPSCRRISSGLIAQVALLPFWGEGPLSPRGQHPILGPRRYLPYCRLYCEVRWWWLITLSMHPRLACVNMKSQGQREAQLQFKYLRLCYKDDIGWNSKQDYSSYSGIQGFALINYLISI